VGSRVLKDVERLLFPPEIEPQFLSGPENSPVAIASERYILSVGHKIRVYSKSVPTESHTRNYSAKDALIWMRATVGRETSHDEASNKRRDFNMKKINSPSMLSASDKSAN
jgi:hypothetical protein